MIVTNENLENENDDIENLENKSQEDSESNDIEVIDFEDEEIEVNSKRLPRKPKWMKDYEISFFASSEKPVSYE